MTDGTRHGHFASFSSHVAGHQEPRQSLPPRIAVRWKRSPCSRTAINVACHGTSVLHLSRLHIPPRKHRVKSRTMDIRSTQILLAQAVLRHAYHALWLSIPDAWKGTAVDIILFCVMPDAVVGIHPVVEMLVGRMRRCVSI